MFTAAEVYDGDPLAPDMETVTPLEVVAALTPEQRETRVWALIDQAFGIIDMAEEALANGRTRKATCLLWSGGKDSNTLAHLMRHRATHVVMANTGIGIEQTRQFVRTQAAAWGLPLIEKHPPQSYRELVIERGFPGPGMHWKMYQRLKERCFDAARRDLGIANSRSEYALFIAGRRREESERREDVPAFEADGSVIWVSPMVMWTSLDLNTYRTMMDKRDREPVPHNEVTALIHMSGECLCGAFAHPGEREEIAAWFPDWHREMVALEDEVARAGIGEPLCQWGWGSKWDGPLPKSGRLCGTCTTRRADGQATLFGDTA